MANVVVDITSGTIVCWPVVKIRRKISSKRSTRTFLIKCNLLLFLIRRTISSKRSTQTFLIKCNLLLFFSILFVFKVKLLAVRSFGKYQMLTRVRSLPRDHWNWFLSSDVITNLVKQQSCAFWDRVNNS